MTTNQVSLDPDLWCNTMYPFQPSETLWIYQLEFCTFESEYITFGSHKAWVAKLNSFALAEKDNLFFGLFWM